MIVMIDGPMISRFLEDAEEFGRYADEQFKMIDHRNDGVMKYRFAKSEIVDDNVDDREVFRGDLMKMMAAVAQGIGKTPVKVLVEEGSLLIRAYEVEIERLKKEAEAEAVAMAAVEEEEEKKKKSVGNGNHERRIVTGNGDVKENGDEIVGQKKLKKKSSLKLLSSFCVCSGNYAQNS